MGAHYGGAPALGGPLGRYGHHLGMAFQIVDDRLDLTGDEPTVGKTLGRDLLEGKTTLPVIAWLRQRSPEEHPDAVALVEAAWHDPEMATRLRDRLAEDGALEEADRAARVELELAQAELEALPGGEERDLLATIADYVLRRRR